MSDKEIDPPEGSDNDCKEVESNNCCMVLAENILLSSSDDEKGAGNESDIDEKMSSRFSVTSQAGSDTTKVIKVEDLDLQASFIGDRNFPEKPSSSMKRSRKSYQWVKRTVNKDLWNLKDTDESLQRKYNFVLKISNFPTDWCLDQLKDFINKEYGPVDYIYMGADDNMCFIGIIKLEFVSFSDCQKAFENLHGKVVEEIKLFAEMREYDEESDDESTPAKKKKLKQEPWEPDIDIWDTDPKGLYGFKAEHLASLGIKPPIDRWVHVTNFRCDKSELKEVLELAGEVLTCSVDTRDKKFARVMYSHPLEAVQAVQMLNNQLFYGQPLKVTMDNISVGTTFLPKGLHTIGPGLSKDGKPLRDIVKQYERFMKCKSSHVNPLVFQDPDFVFSFSAKDSEYTAKSNNPGSQNQYQPSQLSSSNNSNYQQFKTEPKEFVFPGRSSSDPMPGTNTAQSNANSNSTGLFSTIDSKPTTVSAAGTMNMTSVMSAGPITSHCTTGGSNLLQNPGLRGQPSLMPGLNSMGGFGQTVGYLSGFDHGAMGRYGVMDGSVPIFGLGLINEPSPGSIPGPGSMDPPLPGPSNVHPPVQMSVSPPVTNVPSPVTSVPPPITTNLPSPATSNVPPSVSTNVSPTASTNVPPPETTNVTPTASTNVPPLETTNVTPTASTNVPTSETANVFPPITTNVSPSASTNVPPSVTTTVPPPASVGGTAQISVPPGPISDTSASPSSQMGPLPAPNGPPIQVSIPTPVTTSVYIPASMSGPDSNKVSSGPISGSVPMGPPPGQMSGPPFSQTTGRHPGQLSVPPGQMNSLSWQIGAPSQINGPPEPITGRMTCPPGQMGGPSVQMRGPPGQMFGPHGPISGPPGPMNMNNPGPINGPSGQMGHLYDPMSGPTGPMNRPPGQMTGPMTGPMNNPPGPMSGISVPMAGPSGPMNGPSGQMSGFPGPISGPSGPMNGPGPRIGPPGSMNGPGPMNGPPGQMGGSYGSMSGPSGPINALDLSFPMNCPPSRMSGPPPMNGPGPMGGPYGPMNGPAGQMSGLLSDPSGPMNGPRGPMNGPPFRQMSGPHCGQLTGPRGPIVAPQNVMLRGNIGPRSLGPGTPHLANNYVTVELTNLPPSTTFPLLSEKMAEVGRVMSLQLTAPGCAVVQFAEKQHAEMCFRQYNNRFILGNVIQVKYL